jgi:putative NADH-flavin reductase
MVTFINHTVMKVVIFGASGLTGHELVAQALQKSYDVTAFVRDPAKLKIRNNLLNIVQGNVADAAVVKKAVENQDAVLIALGAKTPFKHDRVLIDGVRNIVEAMKVTTARRLIYESYLGVRENRKELGFIVNHVVSVILAKAIADHEEKEAIIKGSGLLWTIVRPPKLTNGPFTGQYHSGEHITSKSLLLEISRADVADFMLKQIDSRAYIHKTPRILY